MRTKRPQNQCSDCAYSWFPKGKSLSNRCPNCGSQNVMIAPGCIGLLFNLVGWIIRKISSILVVGILLIIAAVVFVLVRSPDKSGETNSSPVDSESPALKSDSPKTAEKPDSLKRAPSPASPKPRVDPSIVGTLESTPLPVTVVTTEAISLLNEAGNETPLPAQTTIKILERAKLGSLNMEIGGKTFVGNESRLAGKAKFVGK